MRRLSKYLCIFAVLSVVACDSDPFTLTIGEEFVDPTTKVVVIDTLKLRLSTLKKDSIATSGTGTVLAGSYNDEESGRIIARSYFQVGIPEYFSIEKDEIFDSVSLILTYNEYFFGDTAKNQCYSIHQLSEDLESDDNGNIYNTAVFGYHTEPCGTIRFGPRPIKNDYLEISLNKELGQEIFDYLINEDPSTTDFLTYFKGMVIVPDEFESNSILGFGAADSTLSLKIFSHESAQIKEQKEHILSLVNSNLQYNQISCDWSNNPRFIVSGKDYEIPATETDDLSYIQNGLGLYTKLTFPSLPSITELKNSVLIKANLYMEPVKMSNWEQRTANELWIYEADQSGDIGDALGITADFYLDEMYDEDTYFVFDITSFLSDEIADGFIEPEMGFYIGFSSTSAATTLDMIVLAGDNIKYDHLKLELTFFRYDQ
jgi:hypothetical protein